MRNIFLSAVALFLISSSTVAQGNPEITEVWNPVPKIIKPGARSSDAPSDAIILFDGKNTNEFIQANGKDFSWKTDSGYMMVKPGTGGIKTKLGFGNCQLHIEWRTPFIVKGKSQGRGNSGIFLMRRYEVQVLDNFNNSTYSNGQAASIYKQRMPLVNACRPAGEWQSYDIIFTAPEFYNDSTLKSAARVTVLHNGVLVQNNVEIWGNTGHIGIPKYKMHSNKEPIELQDHGDLVSYRNIWIREL